MTVLGPHIRTKTRERPEAGAIPVSLKGQASFPEKNCYHSLQRGQEKGSPTVALVTAVVLRTFPSQNVSHGSSEPRPPAHLQDEVISTAVVGQTWAHCPLRTALSRTQGHAGTGS